MTNTAPIQEKEKRFHLIKEPDPYGKWSFINKLFFSKKVVFLSADGSADKVIVKKRSLGLIWFLLFVAIFVVCISLFITFPSNPDLGNLFYIIRQMFQPCYKVGACLNGGQVQQSGEQFLFGHGLSSHSINSLSGFFDCPCHFLSEGHFLPFSLRLIITWGRGFVNRFF